MGLSNSLSASIQSSLFGLDSDNFTKVSDENPTTAAQNIEKSLLSILKRDSKTSINRSKTVHRTYFRPDSANHIHIILGRESDHGDDENKNELHFSRFDSSLQHKNKKYHRKRLNLAASSPFRFNKKNMAVSRRKTFLKKGASAPSGGGKSNYASHNLHDVKARRRGSAAQNILLTGTSTCKNVKLIRLPYSRSLSDYYTNYNEKNPNFTYYSTNKFYPSIETRPNCYNIISQRNSRRSSDFFDKSLPVMQSKDSLYSFQYLKSKPEYDIKRYSTFWEMVAMVIIFVVTSLLAYFLICLKKRALGLE